MIYRFVLAVMLLLPANAIAQTTGVNEPALPHSPRLTDRFPVGETLVFEGKFGLLRLGRASMRVLEPDTIRGDSTSHFRFLLQANALGLIRIRDQFDSWVGIEDFESRRFIQHFDEQGKKRTNRYEIFPDSGLYHRPDVDTALVASPNPLDDTAFFYFVRSLDLEPGRTYEYGTYFRPDRNPVIIEVIGRDTIDVPAGRFATVVVRPVIKGGGIFKESANARMWISEDPRRLIVQMKSKFGFGVVTLRLTDVRGIDESPNPETPARP